MDEILDNEIDAKNSLKYSKRSLKFALISFGCTILLIVTTYVTINLASRNHLLEIVTNLFSLSMIIFGIVALINSIQSIVQKEKTTYRKVIGLLWSAFVSIIFAIGTWESWVEWFG